MLEVGAAAATDVTGFGLIGHLYNMVRWGGIGAEVWAESIPLLDGVLELASQGSVPGGTGRNADYFGQFVSVDPDVDSIRRTILFDAQTSGGLLIAVAEARAADLLAGLTERRTPAAAVIGRITEQSVGRITVRSEA
jgi:selenide,water dikinase